MYYDKFEELCKEKGVNPRAVSIATGIAPATLSNWKKGNYTPKTNKLQKICDYFEVPLEYLTGKSQIVKNPMQPNLNDIIVKSYFQSPEYDASQSTIYIRNSKMGKRLVKAKVLSIEPYEEEELPPIINDSSTDNQNTSFFDSLSFEDQQHIIDLYQKYQNADPKIQAAVEALLKDQ